MSEVTAKAKRRARNHSVRQMPEEDPDFQIAPMIDVLLVLLVFFMSISSTEVLQSAKNITLPVAAEGNDAAKNKGQVIINVAWQNLTDTGTITVDEKNYPDPAALSPLLAERVAANPATRVLIRADKQTRYAFMRAIMVTVGESHISNVTFSVVNKEGPPDGASAQ